MLRTRASLLLAFGLIVVGCGGRGLGADSTTTSGPDPINTTTISTAPTTSEAVTTVVSTTIVAATTTTSSSTTTSTTTTTTLPAPPPVEGWDGDGVRSVAITLDFEPPLAALDMEADAEDALEAMGIDVESDAAAVLEFEVEGTPYSDVYGEFGRCYTAARIEGTVRLTAPDRPTVAEAVSYRLERPFLVFRRNCSDDPDDAPYAPVFQIVLPDALAGIWGPSAVPYLVASLDGKVDNTGWDYPHWAAVMDAFRGLPDDQISGADTKKFLGRVIEVVQELVSEGYTPHGVDVAARRVLEAYAGVNYGVSTETDVEQWREWLAGWEGS